MLDILGNVFGKSKKSSQQQQSTNGGHPAGTDDTPQDHESYVFVQNSSTTYASQATILTDELIRNMGTGSSMPQPNVYQGAQASTSTPGHAVYPSLDVTNGYNPQLPFASPASQQQLPNQRHSLAAPTPRRVQSGANLTRNASPIDNVPFAISLGPGGSACGGGGPGDDDGEVTDTLDRIHQFMNNPNQSEYNFKLENSILGASFAT